MFSPMAPYPSRHLILFAEKNRENIDFKKFLEEGNFEVTHVAKTSAVLDLLKHAKDAVILVDITDNEMALLEFCHSIKSNFTARKNILVAISGSSDEHVEVAAFRAGVDDFMRKPVRRRALLERLKAKLGEPKDSITLSPKFNGHESIYIDKESYTAFVDNEQLELSRKEFELLFLLASVPGKIFKREEILEKIWRKKLAAENRTVDVHILRLRKKLGKAYIQTQKGVGYRFVV
jgi:two-component system alkaline phosphatase synthesis response regulator PhoP